MMPSQMTQNHKRSARIDLLFTMSDNTRASGESRLTCELVSHERVLLAARVGGVAARSKASGGARRDRTDDLLLAKQALSQLSYGPVRGQIPVIGNQNSQAAHTPRV